MIDLEFAKFIGAEWYRPENECYYKVQNNTLVCLAYGDDGWRSSAHEVEWIKENVDEIDYTPLNKEKKMKGHPHAELALQYWTEAKEDAEAWKNWEVMTVGTDVWVELVHPFFFRENQYRRKPKIKLINGFDVPDISFMPVLLEDFYYPNPAYVDLYGNGCFYGMTCHLLSNNLCYPCTEEGKAAAIKHALAMLGFDSVEEMTCYTRWE